MSYAIFNSAKNKIKRLASILLISFGIQFSGTAQESAPPKSYMMEKYGISQPFYCDLEDPIEELACLAWDASLGIVSHRGSKFDLNFALEALNLIQSKASTGRQGLYMRLFGAKQISSSNARICITEKRGLCGNHADLMKKVLSYADIPVRSILIYYYSAQNKARTNHAATEVLIENKWRFFDISWGSIWVTNPSNLASLQSFESITKAYAVGSPIFRLSNKLNSWFQLQYSTGQDPFYYLNASQDLFGVIYDDEGTITFSPDTDLGFQHLPNYVGTSTGKNTGIAMRWKVSEHGQNLHLKLDVADVAGCYSNGAVLLDDAGTEYPLIKGSNNITVPNGGLFSVKRNPDEICYIVFDDIALSN